MKCSPAIVGILIALLQMAVLASAYGEATDSWGDAVNRKVKAYCRTAPSPLYCTEYRLQLIEGYENCVKARSTADIALDDSRRGWPPTLIFRSMKQMDPSGDSEQLAGIIKLATTVPASTDAPEFSRDVFQRCVKALGL